ncbi:MAG: serpin family protein [Elusimicrobiota bacterium]
MLKIALLLLMSCPSYASDHGFALSLYHRLAASEKGNIFFSPHSISAALTMTYAGAGGRTASQMASALRLGGDAHAACRDLAVSLDEAAKLGNIEFRVANALWGQKGFGFKKSFLELTERYYDAGLHEMDFKRDSEGARKTINTWVEGKTAERIRDLIGPGVLDAMTRLVLTNAIYFKGDWAAQFKEDSTAEEDFQLGGGRTARVPMMRQTREFRYLEVPGLQALELPYAGERLSMLILLPPEGELKALESELDEGTLAGWIKGMRRKKVRVQLPRFKASSGFRLDSVLKAMGMRDAFSVKSADFSGMDGKKDLYIGAVLHKAFVDVNEQGTEAAAATAVSMVQKAASAPPPQFRADRPFLYLIRDAKTGAILFMGRLADPRA